MLHLDVTSHSPDPGEEACRKQIGETANVRSLEVGTPVTPEASPPTA